ncbi:FAD:protein FMN transferase [Rathayibacter sp. CAU 1779]
MGTVASIHVLGDAVGGPVDEREVQQAIDACLRELADLEQVFSPFRADSDISRIRAGVLAPADADARVTVVSGQCEEAKRLTHGLFDAWHQGRFDPTGYVKGWATETAARHSLEPLLDADGVDAVGIGVGGDMQLFTAEGSDWRWHVGIADPAAPGGVAATIEVRTGAVATSGTAERGSHIIDPRTGSPATTVASATVVADGLTAADLWATTAVIAGFDDLTWIGAEGVRSGIMISPSGAVRRWAGGIELSRWYDPGLTRPSC